MYNWLTKVALGIHTNAVVLLSEDPMKVFELFKFLFAFIVWSRKRWAEVGEWWQYLMLLQYCESKNLIVNVVYLNISATQKTPSSKSLSTKLQSDRAIILNICEILVYQTLNPCFKGKNLKGWLGPSLCFSWFLIPGCTFLLELWLYP